MSQHIKNFDYIYQYLLNIKQFNLGNSKMKKKIMKGIMTNLPNIKKKHDYRLNEKDWCNVAEDIKWKKFVSIY